MLLLGDNSPKIWLFVTILVSTIITFSETSGGKKFDIKIGFDLTQGSKGAPSLRIRDFEGSHEYNPRAVDDVSSSDSSSGSGIKKSSPRDDSSLSAEHPKKEESKGHVKAAKSNSNSDGEDEDKSSVSHEDRQRSTRGMKAADFEPEEESPKMHAKYDKSSDTDRSDRRRRRR